MAGVKMVEAIQQIGLQMQEAQQGVNIGMGEVLTVNPYSIRISQKLVIDESVLVFSETVLGKDTIEALNTIDTGHIHPNGSFNSKTAHVHIDSAGGETEESTIETSHSHPKAGGIYNLKHKHKTVGLAVGDKVIYIREAGGQRYYIIDKVGEINDTDR